VTNILKLVVVDGIARPNVGGVLFADSAQNREAYCSTVALTPHMSSWPGPTIGYRGGDFLAREMRGVQVAIAEGIVKAALPLPIDVLFPIIFGKVWRASRLSPARLARWGCETGSAIYDAFVLILSPIP